MRFQLSACALAITTLLVGCDVPGGGISVEQTDTGIIIEITCPGLDDVDGTDDGEETPAETPDLEPGADEEVEGETPAAIDG